MLPSPNTHILFFFPVCLCLSLLSLLCVCPRKITFIVRPGNVNISISSPCGGGGGRRRVQRERERKERERERERERKERESEGWRERRHIKKKTELYPGGERDLSSPFKKKYYSRTSESSTWHFTVPSVRS